ncbi:MAG: DUF4133 domain-containing protein [Pedobacter sp.]|nr:DUF4133 domain-containing protein [Pedobacter sp.]
MGSVYQINKGVSRPIEFKGLKGQYIAILAGGLVFLLALFAVLYISGVPLYFVLVLVLGLGLGLFYSVFRLCKRFGVHGLSKYLAKRGIPSHIRFCSRKEFTGLKVLKGGLYGRV